MMDEIQKRLLAEVADLHGVPEGATTSVQTVEWRQKYNGKYCIVPKTDVSGIDIYIKSGYRK